MQHPVWSRVTNSDPAIVQQDFRSQRQNPATHFQRKSQSRGGGRQGSSQRCAVSDPWVLSTITHRYRLQFRQRPIIKIHTGGRGRKSPTKRSNFKGALRRTADWILFRLFHSAKKRRWSSTHSRPQGP